MRELKFVERLEDVAGLHAVHKATFGLIEVEMGKDYKNVWRYTPDSADLPSHKRLPHGLYCDDERIDRALEEFENTPVSYDNFLENPDDWPELESPTPQEAQNLHGSIFFDDSVKHTNEAGGTQTQLPVRVDLIPPEVLLRVAAVLHEGADKYGEWNWENIKQADHINHALTHILRYLSGDKSEPHLAHALCRVMFADHLDHKLPCSDS